MFVIFCCFPVHEGPSEKGTLKGNTVLPMGVYSLIYRAEPFSEGHKMSLLELPPLKVYPFPEYCSKLTMLLS